MESKYILVYDIDRYPDEGGGVQYEKFENETALHETVNSLATQYKDKFSVIVAGWMHHEFEYEPVTQTVEYMPKRK